MMRSFRFSELLLKLKRLPMSGRLERSGMPDLVFSTVVTVSPPITAVSPSATSSWFLVSCLATMKPRSAAARVWMLERSVARSREIWPSLVTCGVTSSLMPVSRNCTLARTATPAPVGALASMTRIGMSSPTRIMACLLSWVVMVGSAWTSERLTCSSAWRKLVKEKPPITVLHTRLIAGFEMFASAFPIAASSLPPRLTTLTPGS